MTTPATTLLAQTQAAFAGDDSNEAARLTPLLLAEPALNNDALHVLGVAAVKKRWLGVALPLLEHITARDPHHAPAHTYLGAALLLSDRNAQALQSLNRALALNKSDLITLNIHACVLGNLNRHAESVVSCDAALAINPDYVKALINRGNALVALNRPQEALNDYERVLTLKPGFVEVMNNCANVLKQLQRYAEAFEKYALALKARPDYVEAAFNGGVLLGELQRPREAIAYYRRAAQLDPNHIQARYNLSLAQLQAGHYAQGWKNHECRWDEAQMRPHRREFAQPLWLGREPLKGKTLLLHAEGGLGDTLHFCRYAQCAAARGAKVMLQVQRPLVKLLSTLKGAHRVIARNAHDSRLPKFDYHCPMMSLPLAFNTRLNSVPAQVPYIRAGGDKLAQWRKQLGRKTRPRVGLVWTGNPNHRNDNNRSIAFAEVLPLLDPRYEWVSLQQAVREADAPLLVGQTHIRHYGPKLKDFTDTAALTALMDLVISVDTSVAHLAGAMGKRVWILLPPNPDWRWLTRRPDSPWYPTARLFRQGTRGDWPSVIAQVARALRLAHLDRRHK